MCIDTKFIKEDNLHNNKKKKKGSKMYQYKKEVVYKNKQARKVARLFHPSREWVKEVEEAVIFIEPPTYKTPYIEYFFGGEKHHDENWSEGFYLKGFKTINEAKAYISKELEDYNTDAVKIREATKRLKEYFEEHQHLPFLSDDVQADMWRRVLEELKEEKSYADSPAEEEFYAQLIEAIERALQSVPEEK